MENRLRALELVAGTLSPALAGNATALQALLKQRPILHEVFNAGIFVTDLDGIATTSIPRSTERIGVSFMDRDLTADALKDAKATVRQFGKSKTGPAPIVGMAAPIRDDHGKLVGALAGLTDLNKPNFLDKFVDNSYGESGGYLLFLAQHRLAVTAETKAASPNYPPPWKPPRCSSALPKVTKVPVLQIIPKARKYWPRPEGIPLAGWFVAATLTTDEALAPFYAARKHMLLATILLAMLGGGVVWLMLRQQLLPMLTAVKTLAIQSKSNQPPQPLSIVREDEIGALIGGFNRLLMTLKQREESLEAAKAKLRIAAVAFESQEGMMITDSNGVIVRVNKSFTEITGYTAEEVVGQTPRLLKSGRHDASFYAEMWERIHRTGSWQGEIWDRRKNGEIYPKWLSITAVKPVGGTVTHYIGSQTDITERKATEDAIRHLAFFDALTKLPNRRLLNDRLSQSMAASKRSGHFCALMFLDLDNFKPLNDAHGHVVGDLLLIEAANRLKSCVREMDTVARFGGDEFVVILNELNTDESESNSQARNVAEKIRSFVSAPYLLIRNDGKTDITVEHHCTASIGAVMFIGHEASQDDILKWADAAMYQAKDAGRNSIRFFDAKA